MADHYDARETRDPAAREAELLSRLPDVLRAPAPLGLPRQRDGCHDATGRVRRPERGPAETATLRALTKLGGTVELTSQGSLPRIAAE